jgi:hypothetical protein
MTRSWLDFISTEGDPLPDHWLGELERLQQEQANELKWRKRTPGASQGDLSQFSNDTLALPSRSDTNTCATFRSCDLVAL